MEHIIQTKFTRRRLQRMALALPAPLALALLGGRSAGIAFAQDDGTAEAGATPVLAPTPSCADETTT